MTWSWSSFWIGVLGGNVLTLGLVIWLIVRGVGNIGEAIWNLRSERHK